MRADCYRTGLRGAALRQHLLTRHSDSSASTHCAVSAGCSVNDSGCLRFAYWLEGDVSRLRVPPPRPAAQTDGLWQHSCFEAFVRRAGGPQYLEFNFSPSGEWAAYRFSAYRKPDAHALEMPAPEVCVRQVPSGLELEAVVNIGELGAPASVLEIGLCAVIELQDGGLSYWALNHPFDKPDFHHPESFVLTLTMDDAGQN